MEGLYSAANKAVCKAVLSRLEISPDLGNSLGEGRGRPSYYMILEGRKLKSSSFVFRPNACSALHTAVQ